MILGDGPILVEVELFEDGHHAVLDAGKPKDLHTDVVYDLPFKEISLFLREYWLGSIGFKHKLLIIC